MRFNRTGIVSLAAVITFSVAACGGGNASHHKVASKPTAAMSCQAPTASIPPSTTTTVAPSSVGNYVSAHTKDARVFSHSLAGANESAITKTIDVRKTAGNLTIKKNETLSNTRIVGGGIDFYGTHLKLDNVVIEVDGKYWWGAIVGRQAGVTIKAKNLTICARSGGETIGNAGFSTPMGGHLYIDRADISGTGDGIQVSYASIIQNSFIHDLSGKSHDDGIQLFGGPGEVLIVNNRIDLSVGDTFNSAIFAQNHDPHGIRATIQDNWLKGGAYSLYLEDGTFELGNNQITDAHYGAYSIAPAVSLTACEPNIRISATNQQSSLALCGA